MRMCMCVSWWEWRSVSLQRINGQGQGEDSQNWLRQTLADVPCPMMKLRGECRYTIPITQNIIVAELHSQMCPIPTMLCIKNRGRMDRVFSLH